MTRLFALIAITGCGATATPPSNHGPAAALTITAGGLDLVTATPAKLDALQAKLPGYVVTEQTEGDDQELSGGALTGGIAYDVAKNGERLFYVVPYEDDSIFYLQVVSPKVAVAGHPWQVGGKLAGRITDCNCWGDKAVC